MAQKTAVEWLIHQFNTRQKPLDNSQIDELFQEAKAMEKQQITFAYNDGADAIVAGKYKSMEDYYNELYKSRQDKADK
jgi:hypothetical protein